MSSSSTPAIKHTPNISVPSTSGIASNQKKIERYQLILSLFLETEGKKHFSKNALSLISNLPVKGKSYLLPKLDTTPAQVAKNISRALANGHLLDLAGEKAEAIRKISSERSPAEETLKRIIHYLNSEEMCERWSRNEKTPNTRVAVKRILDFLSDKTQKDLDLSDLGLRSLPTTVFSSALLVKKLGAESVKEIKDSVKKEALRAPLVEALAVWAKDENSSWENSAGDAEVVTQKILEFFDDNDRSSLVLNNLLLTTLPPVFHLLGKRLTTLSLLDCGLENVSEIYSAHSLKKLCLAKNKLKTLPDGLAATFPNLEELDLCENEFEAIPPCIYEMNLRELDISQNQIRGQFKATGKQRNLKVLLLHANPDLTLTGYQHLSAVEMLTVSKSPDEEGVRFMSLGKDEEQFCQLNMALKQWSCNEPSEYKHLARANIREFLCSNGEKALDLRNLCLLSLPPIFDFPFVKSKLGEKEVQHLQEAQQQAANRTLLIETLAAWKMTEEYVAKAASQEIMNFLDSEDQSTLFLDGHGLTTLPPIFHLLGTPSLRVLYLVGNSLTTLPDELASTFPDLEELNLSENTFTTIPPCIYQMGHLKRLNLSDNAISGEFEATEIHSELKELQLHINEDLKVSGFEHLTKLEILTVEEDPDISCLNLPKTCRVIGPGKDAIQALRSQRRAGEPGPWFVPCREDESIDDVLNRTEPRAADRALLIKALETWKAKAQAEMVIEEEAEAKIALVEAMILDFFDDEEQSYLTLANTNLKTLPLIFNFFADRLTGINLSNCQLESFPVELYAAPLLIEINLTKNKLSELPSDLASSFPQLEALYLSNNQFEKVPKCIYNITSLVELQIGDNPIEDLFCATEKQEKLEILSLDGTRCIILKGCEHLTGLKNLGIEVFDAEELAKLPKGCRVEGLFNETIDTFKEQHPNCELEFAPYGSDISESDTNGSDMSDDEE